MSEIKIWSGTSSQIVNLGVFIFWGVVTCIMLVFKLGIISIFPMLIILWKWIVVKTTKYELTSERLKTKVGVFNVTTDELELYRIQDYQMYQPFFLRIFSLSNITLQTSDHSHPYVVLQAIPNGNSLLSKIRSSVEECKNNKRMTMIDVQ